MLSEKEALYYNEQLHPAFAGYLQDGSISNRDALAAIFHLLTKNLLTPVWEDGNMMKKIVEVRKSSRQATLDFDLQNKAIIELSEKLDMLIFNYYESLEVSL